MPDREKVIKGLEFTKAMITFNPSTGEDIEPGNLNEADRTTYDACVGALALLKEQDEKTGTWQWKIHGKAESGGTLGEAICDQCGESTYATAVKGNLNYCPNCGAKMTDRR